jgi:hypothetical protein
MRLEHYPQEKFKKEIKQIVDKHLLPVKYRLFVFGSRVNTAGDEHSDIDIGIEAANEIPAKTIAQLREDIENLNILYKIELVDFKKANSEFKSIALKSTEEIN